MSDDPERDRDEASQYANYGDALKAIPARYPIPGPLSRAEFDDFLATNGPWKGVEVEDVEL